MAIGVAKVNAAGIVSTAKHFHPGILQSLFDRFTVAGDPDECAAKLHALSADLPQITGLRMKLARPVKTASYEDYVDAIRSMGEVISALRGTAALA